MPKAASFGAKTGMVVDMTTLLVAFASSGALTAVVTAVSAWVMRNQGRTAKLKLGDDELELTGLSATSKTRPSRPGSHVSKSLLYQWLMPLRPPHRQRTVCPHARACRPGSGCGRGQRVLRDPAIGAFTEVTRLVDDASPDNARVAITRSFSRQKA